MTRKCCSPRLRSSKWFIVGSHRKWNKWLKWWFFEKSWESLKIPRHFCFKICWNVRPSSPEVASIGLHIQGFTSETWHPWWISIKICQVDDLKVNKSKDVRIQVFMGGIKTQDQIYFANLGRCFYILHCVWNLVKLFCSLAKRGTSLKQGRCVKGKNCFLDRFLALLLGA